MARVRAKRPTGRHGLHSAPGPSRRPARHAPVYGALDLGTNNCRLLLAVPHPSGFRVVGSFSRIVRLGEGLATSGRLAESAVERTLAALAVCARRIRAAGVERLRCVATEACRRAANGGAFLDRAHAETGIALEPITIDEEASLTLAGCFPLVDPTVDRVLLFDIGGGSTEVIWAARSGEGLSILAMISMPLGVVTLAERFGGNALCPASYGRIIEETGCRLRRFDAEHGIARHVAGGGVQMIGTSGTVTTLGAFTLGLERYQRARVDGLDITFDQMSAANDHLKTLSADARARHPCIGPERSDLVLAGCAILEAVCRQWPVGRLRIADRGIREGLLHAMMAESPPPPQARPGGR